MVKIIRVLKELVSIIILFVKRLIILLSNNPTIYTSNKTMLWDNKYAINPNNTEKPILPLFFLYPNMIPKKPLCIALNTSKNIIVNILTTNNVVLNSNPVVIVLM